MLRLRVFVVLFSVSLFTLRAEDDYAAKLAVPPGFKIEQVLKADPKTHGSWICMARDPQGRLLLGGQRGQPMTRLTLKDGKITNTEVLKLPVTETMGMLFAFDAFYVNANGTDHKGKSGSGLFRLKDSKGDGNFDQCDMLVEFKNGSGEHGAHGIVQGPDKKLYLVNGNFTSLPEGLSPSSPHRNYADDRALPRAEDGNGFGAGKVPPGGYILRLDPDGTNLELFASGQRNTYDIAFNDDGELFGFDSDMEWDWGSPWYRPIRVFHAVSGGDQGYREGSAKWPEYYNDSLPAVFNVGIGCPTGMTIGTGAKFPAKYQRAMYVLDWTYGRLIAVHLQPNGATYSATTENFVAPKGLSGDGPKVPLNLTDALIGQDGAFYFTVGGRGTPARLFRVTYDGGENTATVDCSNKEGAEARALRRKLETFHGKENPAALEIVWPELNHKDRFIRYAARIALERQPVAAWKNKALNETQTNAALTSLLSLARLGKKEDQAALFAALEKFPIAKLDDAQKFDKIRIVQVSLSRHGKPAADAVKGLLNDLNPLYPAHQFDLDRELSETLLALDAPDAVARTVALLESAPTLEEQLVYMLNLRTIKSGWTPELRQKQFAWWARDARKAGHLDRYVKYFEGSGRAYGDGNSLPRFIGNLHAQSKASLSAPEAEALASVLAAYNAPAPKPAKKQPARKLVKEWQTADLMPLLGGVSTGRNFDTGKAVFETAKCLACHKMGSEGGGNGPDLTAIAARFQRPDILISITEPSKVISEQFMDTNLRTIDGKAYTGRVLEENEQRLVIQINPLKPEKFEVSKDNIKLRALSKISPMPEGLLNTFNKDEILDLIAYLESGGRKEHADFKK